MADDYYKLFEEANNHFYGNDYDRAKELYEKIIKLNPDHYRSYQKLAKIELAIGNKQTAIKYYEKSLLINDTEANIWNDLGNVYYDFFDYENAIRCYKNAVEKNKDFYWGYYNIGLSLAEKNPLDEEIRKEASEWFEKALKIKDDYYPALNELGLYNLDFNKLDIAEDYFKKSIKAFPDYKYPYYNLATIYKKKDEREKAKAYLYKALQIDPKYIASLNNLGILYYNDTDYTTAMYYYTQALEIDSKYKYALHNIGLVFDCTEKTKKAYEMYKKALESDPNYEPSINEIKRLEKEYPEEIKKMQGLKNEDLKPETYKNESKLFDPERLKEYFDEVSVKDGNNIQPEVKIDEIKEKKTDEFYAEKFGRNLTKLAKEGKLFEVLGRDKQIRNVLEILFNIKKNNPILVGNAGVGKTAIVEGIAQKIVNGEVPDFFKDKKIIEVNMGMLIAGTKFRGEFEEKLKRIIDEVQSRNDMILFIDEIHTVVGAGETDASSLDAANILKPALARGELRCIGATTNEEYKKYFQKDSALDRRFYKVDIEELDNESTLEILKRLKAKMEEYYKITIEDKLLKLIVDLANEEIKNRSFPDKAIDILEKVFSRSALDNKKKIDELVIKDIIGEFVGIRFIETEEDKGRNLLNMEKFLNERVFGQDEAINRISSIIRAAKQKLDLNPHRPDGVFFFAGPTGVGKTYLAKQLASFLFGSESKLLSLNMSEFSEPHSVSKLIGSPPGYVGHDDIPFFTAKITENPSSLLLLDEIEKAHNEVLKLFLQIFDEGKITDTKGRIVYFSNVTIIMTSNAVGGSETSVIGFASRAAKADVQLLDYFTPEFINRIDDVIIFNSIEKDTARDILTELIMKKTIKNFEKRGITLKFNSTFVDYILENGYSKKLGVRNLEKVFEKEVIASASDFIFKNPEAKTITISSENGKIEVG
ncbi:MAG: AAA family ATPase [Spirochaetes bacterium]|nr:AAA family ATPase [Spirochaetota bacterium]